jgi:hypothetical protein
MSFFQPNIDLKGRLLRAAASILLLIAALWAWDKSLPPLLVIALLLSFLFTAFEALRGWCVARACGIKTKI